MYDVTRSYARYPPLLKLHSQTIYLPAVWFVSSHTGAIAGENSSFVITGSSGVATNASSGAGREGRASYVSCRHLLLYDENILRLRMIDILWYCTINSCKLSAK